MDDNAMSRYSPVMVQDGHVCIHIVNVVGVRRILLVRPRLRGSYISVEQGVFRLALIVHRVETNHIPKKLVQCGM